MLIPLYSRFRPSLISNRYAFFRSNYRILLIKLSIVILTLLIAGESTAQSTVSLVSVNGAGTSGGNGDSRLTAVSGDGRYVAFTSVADDLVPGVTDTNDVSDVFLRDRLAGMTYAVSVRNGSNSMGNGESGRISGDLFPNIGISADGRYVVYSSLATDLVANSNDTNGAADIIVFDRLTGLNALVSSKASDQTSTSAGGSFKPVISANGRVVVFGSSASDLSTISDTNGLADIFARDLQTGITKLVTINTAGNGGANDSSSGNDFPSISDDGRFVAFDSAASNLVVNDTNGGSSFGTDVFVRDLQNNTTILVSANSAGTGSGNLGSFTSDARISGNGRFVVFESRSMDLVTGISYPDVVNNIFLRDLSTNATAIVSVNPSRTSAGNAISQFPSISYDGRLVAFTSDSSNLVDNDKNGGSAGVRDIFVRDTITGVTTLASINSSGTDSGKGQSSGPVEISRDGRFLAFVSTASDLTTTSDQDGGPDVFMRDLSTRITTLLTINTFGVAGGANVPSRLALSDDYVTTFESKARLVSIDANNKIDVFAYSPGVNAIDNSANFVRQHYRDFLAREPDPAGLDFWTNQIAACGNNAQCTEVRRIDVSASFFLSIEFQQTGYLIERFYKTAYGDAVGNSTFGSNHQVFVPAVRFNDFLKDTQRIGRGVIVLQPGWEQMLENNKQAYALEFVQAARFVSAFPTTQTPAQFVDQLNQNAGNVLSQAEQTSVINLFGGAANSSDTAARAKAIRQVAEDQDLYNAEYNRAFVLAEYFGYLRRNPNDAPDGDYTGYDFWLTKLNQFSGNYINAEMVKAFLTSIEYRQRFDR
jgi:hypothetical protein